MEKIVQQWRTDHLDQATNQASDAARAQADAAMKDAPTSAATVGPWFDKHFKKAPISHDTDLFNKLHRAADELKRQLEAAAKPAAGISAAGPK